MDLKQYYQTHKQTLHTVAVACVTVLCCILFFRLLFPIVLPFLLGWLLSLLFCPVVRFLERHHIHRPLGTILVMLVFFGLCFLIGYLLKTPIVRQVHSLAEHMPEYIRQIQDLVGDLADKLATLEQVLPDPLEKLLHELRTEFSSFLLSLLKSATPTGALRAVPNVLLLLLIMLISAYFFTKDQPNISRFYQAHIRPLIGGPLDNGKTELRRSVIAYCKTQVILMCYVFVICLIGLFLIRSPYTILLSLIIAVVDAFPFFGSGLFLWPLALFSLASGQYGMALGYLLIYAAIQVLRQIMQPKILGTEIGLHPLLTLFSMYFGFKTMGFWGLIIGPMLAVILKARFSTHHSSSPSDAAPKA